MNTNILQLILLMNISLTLAKFTHINTIFANRTRAREIFTYYNSLELIKSEIYWNGTDADEDGFDMPAEMGYVYRCKHNEEYGKDDAFYDEFQHPRDEDAPDVYCWEEQFLDICPESVFPITVIRTNGGVRLIIPRQTIRYEQGTKQKIYMQVVRFLPPMYDTSNYTLDNFHLLVNHSLRLYDDNDVQLVATKPWSEESDVSYYETPLIDGDLQIIITLYCRSYGFKSDKAKFMYSGKITDKYQMHTTSLTPKAAEYYGRIYHNYSMKSYERGFDFEQGHDEEFETNSTNVIASFSAIIVIVLITSAVALGRCWVKRRRSRARAAAAVVLQQPIQEDLPPQEEIPAAAAVPTNQPGESIEMSNLGDAVSSDSSSSDCPLQPLIVHVEVHQESRL